MLIFLTALLVCLFLDLIRLFAPQITVRKKVRAVCNGSLTRLRNMEKRGSFAYFEGTPISYFPRVTHRGTHIRRAHLLRFLLLSPTIWIIIFYAVYRYGLTPYVENLAEKAMASMNQLSGITEQIGDENLKAKHFQHYNLKTDHSVNLLAIGFDEGNLPDLLYLLHFSDPTTNQPEKIRFFTVQRDLAVEPINIFQITQKQSGLSEGDLLYEQMSGHYASSFTLENKVCKLNETTIYYNRNLGGISDKKAAELHSRARSIVLNMEKAFDIYVDYYMAVDYESIVRILDVLGGFDGYTVPTDDEAYLNDLQGVLIHQNKILGLNDSIEGGFYSHLNGNQCLALIRERKQTEDGSAAARSRRGMKFLKDIIKQSIVRILKENPDPSVFLDREDVQGALSLIYTDLDLRSESEDAEDLKQIINKIHYYSFDGDGNCQLPYSYDGSYRFENDTKLYVVPTGETLHEQYLAGIS